MYLWQNKQKIKLETETWMHTHMTSYLLTTSRRLQMNELPVEGCSSSSAQFFVLDVETIQYVLVLQWAPELQQSEQIKCDLLKAIQLIKHMNSNMSNVYSMDNLTIRRWSEFYDFAKMFYCLKLWGIRAAKEDLITALVLLHDPADIKLSICRKLVSLVHNNCCKVINKINATHMIEWQ